MWGDFQSTFLQDNYSGKKKVKKQKESFLIP